MATSAALLDCGIDLDAANLVFAGLNFALFIPAFLLNIIAAWVSWNLKTKSSFIVYLKNLVAADLLMTLILPLRAAAWYPNAPLGLQAFDCQFTSVLFYLCMYASILLMGAISINRFCKIVKPWGKVLGQRAPIGKLVSAVIWMVLLGTSTIPTMALTNVSPPNNTVSLCMGMKGDLGKQYHTVVTTFSGVIFYTVFVVMGVCYVCIAKTVITSYQKSKSTNEEGNRKIKAHVFIVLVVFLVCFAPFHIVCISYVPQQVDDEKGCSWARLAVSKDITLWLASTNVCLDPLIYIGLCKSFRQKLYELKLFGYMCSGTTDQSTDSTF